MAPNCRVEGLKKSGLLDHTRWARERGTAGLHISPAVSSLQQPRHQPRGKAAGFRVIGLGDSSIWLCHQQYRLPRVTPNLGKQDHAMRIP